MGSWRASKYRVVSVAALVRHGVSAASMRGRGTETSAHGIASAAIGVRGSLAKGAGENESKPGRVAKLARGGILSSCTSYIEASRKGKWRWEWR